MFPALPRGRFGDGEDKARTAVEQGRCPLADPEFEVGGGGVKWDP